MSIRIVIADDHDVVRQGIDSLFEDTDIEIVAVATNADEVVEKTLEHRPDVVLLDVRLGNSSGLDALEKLRAAETEARIVMLSTFDNPTYVARSVALGADDYVLKASNRETMLTAIRGAHAKTPAPETSLFGRIRDTMQIRKAPSSDLPLTVRETQVLKHIALGLSNREIGRSLGISVETVKEHVQNILRKINATDRTQAAVWAVRRSLV